MKTKVFKLTDADFATYQAIANVDAGGKVYVHYINAFNVNDKNLPDDVILLLCKLVTKWAEKNNYLLWSY